MGEQGSFFVGHLLLILGVGVQGLVGGAGGLPEEGADDVRHDRREGQQLADNDLKMMWIIKAGQQRSHITQKNSLQYHENCPSKSDCIIEEPSSYWT